MAAWAGCLDDFTHRSGGQIRGQDLPVSLGAVLLTEALNLGLSPFTDPGVLALTRGGLTWVQYNYCAWKP